jgi:hypothetical protein
MPFIKCLARIQSPLDKIFSESFKTMWSVFITDQLNESLNCMGIVHELSPPHVPQPTGIVDRHRKNIHKALLNTEEFFNNFISTKFIKRETPLYTI